MGGADFYIRSACPRKKFIHVTKDMVYLSKENGEEEEDIRGAIQGERDSIGIHGSVPGG